jgi:hypothetical protein
LKGSSRIAQHPGDGCSAARGALAGRDGDPYSLDRAKARG